MPAIDSDLIREVIRALRSNATVITNIPTDSNGNLAIHPGNFNPIHNLFPQLTVEVLDGSSEPVIPSSHDALIITIWLDTKTKEQSYSFIKTLSDAIITLFNREGGDFNNIDIPTNTGVRVCFF